MKEFPHYVAMPINEVMANPEKFIIPENLRAIEYLWDMGFVTGQTNDYQNEDSWITFGILSEENQRILDDLRNNDSYIDPNAPGVCTQYGLGIRIPVVPGTKDTFDDFMPLISMLKPQDIQRDGYMTLDEFFVNFTDCWKAIKNPYLQLEPNIENYENPKDFIRDYGEFKRHKYPTTPVIRVFDELKATKDIKEYLSDFGFLDLYDEEEGKIFLNERLFNAHMRYKEQYGKKI